jgi:hypothetical protein
MGPPCAHDVCGGASSNKPHDNPNDGRGALTMSGNFRKQTLLIGIKYEDDWYLTRTEQDTKNVQESWGRWMNTSASRLPNKLGAKLGILHWHISNISQYLTKRRQVSLSIYFSSRGLMHIYLGRQYTQYAHFQANNAVCLSP